MDPINEAARRQAVDFAVRLAAGTPLAPDTYELDLLEQYVRGQLSLPQLLELTEQHRPSRGYAVAPTQEHPS